MYTGVGVELGMEGGDELVALAGSCYMTVDDGQRLGICRHAVDVGGADEGHGDGADTCHLRLCVETAELAAIGVAAHVGVHGGQSLARLSVLAAGQEDEAGAGAEDGQTATDGLADGQHQVKVAQELRLCGALAAGNDEGVLGLLPVAQLPHLKRLYAKAREHLRVFGKRALQG